MEKRKYEVGDLCLLNPENFYWSVELRRNIKFQGHELAIKISRRNGNGKAVGYLIELGNGPFESDYVSKNEILFSDNDIIGDYELCGEKLYYFEW